MGKMKEKYLAYYTPLVHKFCTDLADKDLEGLECLPQPFIPLFGKGYENSSLRLLIIGQDTRWWGNAKQFIDSEMESPGREVASVFSEVEDFKFRKYGETTHSFWGFTMALFASIYGMPNWNVLKWGGYEEVLSSIAWGNTNAILLWQSLRKDGICVPRGTWEAARSAGAHFNRFKHMLETLQPRVVVVTVKSLNFEEFFEGYALNEVSSPDSNIKHYQIDGDDDDVDIFHMYHPSYMHKCGGPRSFLNRLRETMKQTGLAPDFPEFVKGDEADGAVADLLCNAYKDSNLELNKYTFVEWVAGELEKHKAFMSVSALIQLINRMEFKTNDGTPYAGGRGSYQLVRGAYYRALQRDQAVADRISKAFRKPNFAYAYK